MAQQPHIKVTECEATTGVMLSTYGNTLPTIVDTVETTVATQGDMAVMVLDSLPKPPDSLAQTDTPRVTALLGKPTLITNDPDIDSIAITDVPTIYHPVANTDSTTTTEPTESYLHVYPNPIPRGSAYKIMWPEAGRYQVALFAITGALVQQSVIDVSSPQQVSEFQLSTSVAAGIYFLRAIRPGQSQPYTAKILVQ